VWRQHRGPRFKKREKWRTPSYFASMFKDNLRYTSLLMWPTLYNRVGIVKGHVEHPRSAMLSIWR